MTQFPTKIKVCVSLFWFLFFHRALVDPDENVDVNSVFSISSKMQKRDGEVSV